MRLSYADGTLKFGVVLLMGLPFSIVFTAWLAWYGPNSIRWTAHSAAFARDVISTDGDHVDCWMFDVNPYGAVRASRRRCSVAEDATSDAPADLHASVTDRALNQALAWINGPIKHRAKVQQDILEHNQTE